MESDMNGLAPALSVDEEVEEKDYVVPDASRGKRFANFDDLLNELCTPELLEEVKALAASQTVGHALTRMRIAAGISQKVMAAAMGVTQPRISMIETAPNSRASWSVIHKYVEVTQCPFRAVLEDGSIVSLTRPGLSAKRPGRKPRATVCSRTAI